MGGWIWEVLEEGRVHCLEVSVDQWMRAWGWCQRWVSASRTLTAAFGLGLRLDACMACSVRAGDGLDACMALSVELGTGIRELIIKPAGILHAACLPRAPVRSR